MKIGPLYIIKGGTAYEMQLGRLIVRWTHLSAGGYFSRWKPWRRLRILWWRGES